jgi:hypothetical protein
VVGYAGVGSYIDWWDVLELVAVQCGGIYWSWLLYRVVGYTGVGSYIDWWVILDLPAIQYSGLCCSWQYRVQCVLLKF